MSFFFKLLESFKTFYDLYLYLVDHALHHDAGLHPQCCGGLRRGCLLRTQRGCLAPAAMVRLPSLVVFVTFWL